MAQAAREPELHENTLYRRVAEMKKPGSKSRTGKKYNASTSSKHTLPVHDNVLGQTFTAQA